MQVVRDWRATPPAARGAVVALGNFDGVHLGHAHVLEMARRGRPDAPRAVLTFEPHPRELFRPDDPPFRLTLAAERADALAALGVDWLFELPFDRSFSEHTADAFIEAVLHREVGAAHLACGWDFAFGHRRGGDARVLAQGAAARGIGLTVVPPLEDGQGPISSTRIRRLLQDGYPERAAADLGRPWSIRGIVAHGDARGRTIGFPTANLALGRHLEPARGVYAVRVRLPDGSLQPGVANGLARVAGAVAAEGNIDVIAQEAGQGDVPAPPELADRGGAVGGGEVQRQGEAEHEGEADRHVRIAGEVEVDLQCVGARGSPGLGQAGMRPGGDAGEHRVTHASQGIGDGSLLGQTHQEQGGAAG